MAIIFNNSRNAYTVTDVGVGANFGAPVAIGVVLSAVQENNRRLLGQIYLYRRVIDPGLDTFYAIETLELRQRRSAIRFTYNLLSSDIVRIIPFYDFAQIVIVVQQSGA